jgi:hypothetical protein
LNFALDYTVNDFVDDSMASYSLWGRGCKEGGVDVEGTDLTAILSGDGTAPGFGLGQCIITLTVNVHTPEVESTSIFSETNATGYRVLVGTVSFCVRLSLNTPCDHSVEVDFHETLIDLFVDFSTGFAINKVSVSPRARDKKTREKNYKVQSYDISTTAMEQLMGLVWPQCNSEQDNLVV